MSDLVFKSKWGLAAAEYGEECFSGDGASLFTLVKFDGDVDLVKLGWGEFSRETFEGDCYPHFKKCPFDIYVVDQDSGYFHIRDILTKLNYDYPEYLKRYSVLVARAGVVVKGPSYFEKGRQSMDYPVSSIKYEDMMTTLRNMAISEGNMMDMKTGITEFDVSPTSFSKFLKGLPEDESEMLKMFREYRFYGHKKYLTPFDINNGNYDQDRINEHVKAYYIGMIYQMGVGEKDIKSLISRFDHEKKEFI